MPPVADVRLPLSRRRRWIGWAALVSVVLHAGGLAAMLPWFRHPAAVVEADAEPATVQLVMSPPGSDHAAPAQSEVAPTPLAAEATAGPPVTVAAAAQPEPARQMPKTAPPLTMDLGSVVSDTNALVTGDLVLPPGVDSKFHNRKPSYPMDAALRGEQGAVLLMIHVAPDGLVSRVDVMRTSGFAGLDRAAREAVETWHFLPSVKDGQPVPADMPMRVVFAIDR